MKNLQGKTAVVTGGSRGFGRGIVEALAAEGMRVVAVARNKEALAALKAETPGTIETVAADVTDTTTAISVIQKERPQVLVLNAGVASPVQLTRFQAWETFSMVWDTDVKGTLTWAREALLAPLPEGSAIIIVSSGAALVPSPLAAGYHAAKAGQMMLATCLAVEAQPLGIKVHYLLPNLTSETDMGRYTIDTLAQVNGVSQQAIMEQGHVHPALTPQQVGNNVLTILTDPAHDDTLGFKVFGTGLQPVHEPVWFEAES